MWSGIKACLYREIKNTSSSPRFIVENLMNPLFTLFIFGVIMSNAIGSITSGGQEFSYLPYFMVGTINLSLLTNSLVMATRVFLDKYIGFFDDLLSYPVKRVSLIIGRLCYNLLISLLQILVMFVVVYIFFPNDINLGLPLFFFLLVSLISSSAWFFVLMYISHVLRTQDGFNTLYFLLMTPLVFLSSVYYPVESMPNVLKQISIINPLTWVTDVSRFFLLDYQASGVPFKIIGISVFAVASFILAVRKIDNL
ncbi:MAG: ABC transporter permease [Oscillospiraceae bacterium]|nr:ABC transporter permease [Oscillospiraceae bacterium]